MKNKLMLPGIAAAVALIIGFGAGYVMPHAAAARGAFGGAGATFTRTGGAGGGFGGRAGGGFTAGRILSVGNGTMTIQEQNGSSTEIVLVGPSTEIEKMVSGSVSDLSAGTNVVITGTPNSDGSMTAQSIQLRPAGLSGQGPQAAPMIKYQGQ